MQLFQHGSFNSGIIFRQILSGKPPGCGDWKIWIHWLQESGHGKYPDFSTDNREITFAKQLPTQENRLAGAMSVFKKYIILLDFDHPRPRIVSGYIQNHIIIQPVILKLAEVSETMACVVVHRPLVAALYASPQYYSFYGDGFQLAHYKPSP